MEVLVFKFADCPSNEMSCISTLFDLLISVGFGQAFCQEPGGSMYEFVSLNI